ncbi:hypothetical protein LCGC14_0239270 [marine sediment metagenome]|uniref:Uncharacterized protein n=1 Tax=marine sediment metagenome TaxID=412755 RepID=A0A0F9U872_9ZZZZ|nr:polysaccharide biosynthesis protein [Phycisphaerae bacterium]HDZ43778.1 polysaccharide biosynthesis protein [Phycisphaerae bacterium]
MSKARVQTRNLLVNWFGHSANLVVMFFLFPFIINTLGQLNYGIWCLLVAVTGYMGLLDIGIRASTGRYVIFHTGRDEHDDVNETIQTAMGFFTTMVGGLALIAAAVGWWFPSIFQDVPASYRTLAVVVLPVLACNIWLTALSTIMSSVLASRDRYDLVQAVNLGVLAVRTIGTVVVLTLGWGLAGLVGVLIGAQLVGAVGNFVLAHRLCPTLHVWPFRISSSRLRTLLAFSIPAGLAAFAYKLIHQTDLFVVGIALNASLVAVFAVGSLLPEYIWGFVDHVCVTFFPPIQRAAARDDWGPVYSSYIRQGRMALLVGVPIYVGILVFGEAFLMLWMGGGGSLSDADLASAAQVMRILSGARLVFLFGVGAAPLLTAIGHIRFNAVIGGIEAVANLGLSVFLVVVLDWKLAGVAAGTLISMAIVRGVIHPWRACRASGLEMGLFIRRVVAPGLAIAGLFAVWCLGVRHILPADSWGAFALQVVAAMAAYVPMSYFLLLFAIDRRRILYAIRTSVTGPS